MTSHFNPESASILLIEDDPDTSTMVSLLLEADNYHVVTASTGTEGLSLLKQRYISLVLLDLMLPDMDGFQICQTTKDCHPYVPILILSARSETSDRVRALEIGADDYVTKPFSNKELLARIKAAIRSRRQNGLDTVSSSIPYGVFLVDRAGHLVFCNSRLGQTLKGHTETLLSHSYQVLFHHLARHSGNANKTHDDLNVALERLEAFPVVNLTLMQPDPVHIEVQFFPIEDGSGVSAGWGALVRDVTFRQERLDRLSELLSNLSHELRSPLAAIKGFVSMLSGDHPYWDTEGQQAYLESINESADHLGRMLENVLEMCRLDSGITAPRWRIVTLEPLIRRTVQAAQFFGKAHEFEIAIPVNLPDVEIDPLRIEQVLRNLLENAVKFSPPGSKIVVKAAQQAEEILISLTDQGIGMAQEYIEHIFDHFYQLEQQNVGQPFGVGLGLHICREIVVAHGGRIWADSEPQGGLTVCFTLPLAHGVAGSPVMRLPRVPRPDAAQAVAPALWEAETILVVDDDPQILRFLRISLEAEGYKVLTARRGQAALDLAAQQRFNLILLDIMLPDLDGFRVCERLREFTTIPVIMITARPDERDEVHGLNLGADDYLVKPISQRELLARVRAVLRRANGGGITGDMPILRFGDLTLDLTSRQVLRRGEHVSLSPIEYKLLHFLATNAGHVLTHSQLLAAVWGPECQSETHYLWVNVSRLRRKLGDNRDEPRYILTEPGVGYRFCEN